MDNDTKSICEEYENILEAGWLNRQATRLKAAGNAVGQYGSNLGNVLQGKAAPVGAGQKYQDVKRQSAINTIVKDTVNDLKKLNLFGKDYQENDQDRKEIVSFFNDFINRRGGQSAQAGYQPVAKAGYAPIPQGEIPKPEAQPVPAKGEEAAKQPATETGSEEAPAAPTTRTVDAEAERRATNKALDIRNKATGNAENFAEESPGDKEEPAQSKNLQSVEDHSEGDIDDQKIPEGSKIYAQKNGVSDPSVAQSTYTFKNGKFYGGNKEITNPEVIKNLTATWQQQKGKNPVEESFRNFFKQKFLI